MDEFAPIWVADSGHDHWLEECGVQRCRRSSASGQLGAINLFSFGPTNGAGSTNGGAAGSVAHGTGRATKAWGHLSDRTNPKRGVRLPPPRDRVREAAADRQQRHRQVRIVTCADNGVAHEVFDHGRHCLACGDRVLSGVGFPVASPLWAPPSRHEHQKPSHSHALLWPRSNPMPRYFTSSSHFLRSHLRRTKAPHSMSKVVHIMMTTSFVHTLQDMCRNSNHRQKTLHVSKIASSDWLHEIFVSGRSLALHARCKSACGNAPFWNSHRTVFVQFVRARAAHVVILLPCTTVSFQGCSCPVDTDCGEGHRNREQDAFASP